MTDLLPCPFCGTTPKIKSHVINAGTYWDNETMHFVECDHCDFNTHSDESSMKIKSWWNTRVKPKCLNCECVPCSEFCNVCGRSE